MSASLYINQRGTTKRRIGGIKSLYQHHLRSLLELGREAKYDLELTHLNTYYIDNKLATREELDLWLEAFEPKTSRAQFAADCKIDDKLLSVLKADTTQRINDNIKKWTGTEHEKKLYDEFIKKVRSDFPKNEEGEELKGKALEDFYLKEIKDYYDTPGVIVKKFSSKLKTLEKIVENQKELQKAGSMARIDNMTPDNAILYDSLVIKVPTNNDFDPTEEQLLAMRDSISFLTKGYKKLFTAIHRDEKIGDKGTHLHECYEAFNPETNRFDIRTQMFLRTLEYAQKNGIEVEEELKDIKNWSDDRLSTLEIDPEKKKRTKVENKLLSSYGKLSQQVIFHAVNAAKIEGVPVFEIRPENDETKLRIKAEEKSKKRPKLKQKYSQYGYAKQKAEEEEAKILAAEAKILAAEEIYKTAKYNVNDIKKGIKTFSKEQAKEIAREVYKEIKDEEDKKILSKTKNINNGLIELLRNFNKNMTFKPQPAWSFKNEIKEFSDNEIIEFIQNSNVIQDINKLELAARKYYGNSIKNTAIEVSNDAIKEALTAENKEQKRKIAELNKQLEDVPEQIKEAKKEAKTAAEKERNDHYQKIIDKHETVLKEKDLAIQNANISANALRANWNAEKATSQSLREKITELEQTIETYKDIAKEFCKTLYNYASGALRQMIFRDREKEEIAEKIIQEAKDDIKNGR